MSKLRAKYETGKGFFFSLFKINPRSLLLDPEQKMISVIKKLLLLLLLSRVEIFPTKKIEFNYGEICGSKREN